MVNANWSRDRIIMAVFDKRNRGGFKVQRLDTRHGAERAMKYLEREIAAARKYVDRNAQVLDANGALFTITAWREHVDTAMWKGARGITDRNVLHAMADRGMKLKSATSIPMSARSLAELAGVQFQTASRSLKRLTYDGWLRQVAESVKDLPAIYALRFPDSELDETPSHATIGREVSLLVHSLDPSHDAWRRGALGKGPQRVYVLVLENFGAVAEIASRLGVSKRAVYKHLATLRENGLVTRGEAGGWSCTDKTLDEVAVEWGTAGTGERQRDAHRRQRDGWHGTKEVA
jgi:DNA-binding transcriptional ArsR family regulator